MDIQKPFQSLKPEQTKEPAEQPDIIAAIKQPFEKNPKLEIWKIALVTVLGLAAVGGAAVFLWNRNQVTSLPAAVVEEQPTPTPEITRTWQKYDNTKHYFTVQYPSDWTMTEAPSGDGASFRPQNVPLTEGVTDDITVSVGQKTLTEKELSLEEYAKVAATLEIQNYRELASIEPVELSSGILGYKTTWTIQSIINPSSDQSESPPITYFQVPGVSTALLRISSGYDADQVVYDHMIKSVVFRMPPEDWSTAGTPTPSPAPATMNTPGINEEAIIEAAIKEQILADSSGDVGTLTVSVSKIAGDYAQGLANDDGGGGMWFATKVNGEWKLVWDGNGIIFCSDLTEYPDFPTSMIPECYDPATESSVKR